MEREGNEYMAETVIVCVSMLYYCLRVCACVCACVCVGVHAWVSSSVLRIWCVPMVIENNHTRFHTATII